ncbi:MAG: hypothetical protein IKD62_02180 [Oscillospiraceae bacterium]|nr:hypothetical protein [Oscillospiraceae bacterium]MBR3585534.1 hypothetical protein [Oscillospiraceae bacterium]
MARFYGKIGFVLGAIETRPGIWKQNLVVRNYYGDVMKRRLSWESGDAGVNDDIKIANQFSVLADEYAEQHLYAMAWIEWKGVKWKVTSVEIERPRMILTIGNVYNENAQEESNKWATP